MNKLNTSDLNISTTNVSNGFQNSTKNALVTLSHASLNIIAEPPSVSLRRPLF